MATSTELTFINAVAVAEGVRQQSKYAAFLTYGFAPANLAAYIVALADADVAYVTAVNTAFNASNLPTGGVGFNGPWPSTWAPLLAGA